jgi:EmrB/QacA subfamily drug resistance transporter
MGSRAKAVVVAGTLLGMFTAAMDQTVVSTSLPRIVGSLGGFGLLPWVFTAFMLTSTTIVPIVGKLTDIYGRKPFYMGGIAFLVLGSALAGSSQSMEQLVIYRAVQGLGAGAIMGIAFAIVGDVFPPRERARWSGAMSAVWALASVLGPLIGGGLTDHVHWRWVFYVNLPLGAIALTVLLVGMPAVQPISDIRRLDYRGIPLLLGSVVPMLLAFSWAGTEYPWLSPQILGLFSVSILAIVLFFFAEAQAEDPLVPLSLFKDPIFGVAAIVTVLTGISMFGAISYTPTFVQGVVGSSATNSGFVTMPLSIAMSAASAVSGLIVYRIGRYRWQGVAGFALVALGLFLFSRLDVNSDNLVVTRNMVVMGLGLGLGIPIYMLAVQNAVPHHLMGIATSTIQFLRSVGGTMGVAIIGSIVTARQAEYLVANTPQEVREGVPPAVLKPLEDPQAVLNPAQLAAVRQGFLSLGDGGAALFDLALTAVRTSLADAIAEGFLVAFFVTLAAVVVSVFLREIPLRRTHFGAGEEGAMSLEGPAPADPPPPAGPALADRPR